MANQIPFYKVYTNPHDLVALLQSRGLVVSNPTKAERYLDYIGYYRLSAYMYPLLKMPKEQHQYKQGATFDQIMTLYRLLTISNKHIPMHIHQRGFWPRCCLSA